MTPISLVLIVLVIATFVVRRDLLRTLMDWGLHRGVAYVIPDYLTSKPYLSRFQFPRFGIRPMVHQIHRPDHDRHLHNHPWKWSFSIILSGSYDEERVVGWSRERLGREVPIVKTRRVRFFNFLRSYDYHRITNLHGDVFTLFIAGPRTPGDVWGFLTPVGWVESSEYIAQQKRALERRYRRSTRK